MLAELQTSPFVIHVYHAFQDDDFLYMIMELAEGGDLKSRMGNSQSLLLRIFHYCGIIVFGTGFLLRKDYCLKFPTLLLSWKFSRPEDCER